MIKLSHINKNIMEVNFVGLIFCESQLLIIGQFEAIKPFFYRQAMSKPHYLVRTPCFSRKAH